MHRIIASFRKKILEELLQQKLLRFGKVKIRIKLDHRINRIKPVTTEP
jgi:hypothetical protein